MAQRTGRKQLADRADDA